MSTATEIVRLTDGRNTIRNKLVELGLATSTAKLDALAEAIDGLVNRGAVSVTVKEGETYTIPAGFHNGSGTVSGVSGGGNYTLQSKMATPTKKQQSVTPDDGYYGLSDVTVQAIPDAYQDVSAVTAVAGEVLTGKVIVAADGTVITGTMANNGAAAKTLDVTVIPDAYQDVTSVDADAADVLSGKKIVDATGTVREGSMANNGDVSGTIDGLTVASLDIPAGYTTGGTISLTSDIEDALAAI